MSEINLYQKINFKYLEDILYYDHSIISLGITENNDAVLEVWLEDKIKEYSSYAYILLNKNDLLYFLEEKKFYYDIVKNSQAIVRWKYNEKRLHHDFTPMSLEEFMLKYGPRKAIRIGPEMDDLKITFEKILSSDISLKKHLI